MTSPSILMYSPDSIGLGHMRRHSAIAHALTERVPDVSTLLLVGSAACTLFDLPAGADCVKLPSVLKTAGDTWQPRSLNVSVSRARDLRSDLIRQAAETFQPDIFLVDHLPAGVWGELLPTLRMLREQAKPTKLILGLRDILGAPKEICESWARNGIYDLIDDLYDHILIYGCSEIFPAAELYGLSEHSADKVSYCGYIYQGRSVPDQSQSRADLGMSTRPHIVVAAGGGHDAYPMMHRSLQALRRVCFTGNAEATIITGPLMPAQMRIRLQREAAGLPITILDTTKQFANYLSAADLVITMGGYNTLMETVHLRKRTIVIPRTGPSAEQLIRARQFDNLGLARYLDVEDTSTSDLVAEISTMLAGPSRSEISLTFTGLNTVSQILSGWLSEAHPDENPEKPNYMTKETRAAYV